MPHRRKFILLILVLGFIGVEEVHLACMVGLLDGKVLRIARSSAMGRMIADRGMQLTREWYNSLLHAEAMVNLSC